LGCCGLRWAEGSTSSVVFSRLRQCGLMGGHIGAIWRIRLNCSSAAAMRPDVKLLWPLVNYCDFNYCDRLCAFWGIGTDIGKEKGQYLYSAFFGQGRTLKALRHGSHSFHLQITPCLPFRRSVDKGNMASLCKEPLTVGLKSEMQTWNCSSY